MSIQNEIDRHISEEGGYSKAISITGLGGNANVPFGTYLHLRKCDIGSLTVSSNCVVVIEESTMNGTLTMNQGGSLTMDRVTVSGGSKFDVKDCKVSQKLCTLQCSMELDGGYLEGFRNDRSNSPYGVLIKNGGSAKLAEETFVDTVVGIRLETASHVSARECEVSPTMTAFEVIGKSQLEVLGGAITARDGSVIFADDYSIVNVSGLPTTVDITSMINLVLADNSSKVRILRCGNFTSDQSGFVADNGSEIEVSDFGKVETRLNTIKSTNGSKITLQRGKDLYSLESETVFTNAGSVYIRSVDSVVSFMKEAILSSGSSTAEFSDISREIYSPLKGCVRGSSGDTFLFRNIPIIHNDLPKMTVFDFGSDLDLRIINVKEIRSELAGVLHAMNNVKLEIRKVDEIAAVEGDGLHCKDSANIELFDIGKINAGGFNGVFLGSSSYLRVNRVQRIKAFDGTGISVGSGSSIEVNNFGEIAGTTGAGIEAPASKVVAKNGNKIISEIVGSGLSVTGNGGSIFVQNVSEVVGIEGDGIHIGGGTAEVYNVATVGGGGWGLNASNGSVVSSGSVDRIWGGIAAVKASGKSKARVSGTKSIEGVGGPGVEASDYSSVEVSGATITGAAYSIQVSNNSQVEASNCSCTMGVNVLNSSNLEISSSSIGLNFLLTNSTASASNVSVGGFATLQSSTAELKKVDVAGLLTLNSSSIIGLSISTGSSLMMTSSSAYLAGSSAVEYVPISSALMLVGCSGTCNYTSGVTIAAKSNGALETFTNTTKLQAVVSIDTSYL